MSRTEEQRNPYGYGSNEYYEYEAKKAGFRSVQDHMRYQRETGPKCPHCGTTQGFAWGTGDCGCTGE